MENKDQLNQIPGELQDEKTSQSENQTVEASQQVDETPEMLDESPVDDSSPEESATETSPVDEQSEEEADSAPEVAETNPQTVDATENEVEEEAEPKIETGEEIAPISEEVEKEEVPAEEIVSEVAVEAEITEAPAEAVLEVEAVPEKVKSAETPSVELEADNENDEDDEDDEEDELLEEVVDVVDYENMSREELLEKLETVVGEDDVNKIKSRVALIKVAYLKKTKLEKETLLHESLSKEDADDSDKEEVEEEKTDAQPEGETVAPVVAEDTLETKFKQLFDIYRQKRAVFLDNLEKEKLENLKKKHEILDELKTLISSEETLKKTYDEFRGLQDKWKDIGMVPKTEVNDLWQNYHFLVEMFFDKVKINKELKDLDLKKNLEMKIDLCERAEELLIEPSIIKSFKELQRLHDLWKEVGPVPQDKNEEIWERFKSTTDKINLRRRDHYKQLQDQHDQNFEAKAAICEKAEELLATEVKTIREWQNKTKQFNELFKVWKTIGPAAKKQNDEIWERFKVALDGFFNEKKDYFGKLKDQQINNYNLKLDLCVRAEAIKESTDWRETTRELINMQKEWKEIGPVPRKHSDKIWKRFRTACDEFFNIKSEHFATMRDDEADNLKKKEDLIKLVSETVFGEDKSENLNKLKDFQRQWTEIGHVPFKEKDRLQTEFRNAVNKQLDKLNISSGEISLASYRSKMEVLKGSPDGNRSLSRERVFIQNKITQLRSDINLWENNIGFLANSKKASLFKDEFEKKINKAKSELETLESKLKFLSNQ